MHIITASSKPVVAWGVTPKAPLGDSKSEELNQYEGRSYVYSGWGGDGTGTGNKYVKIKGVLNVDLELKVYGYSAGDAVVSTPFCTNLQY